MLLPSGRSTGALPSSGWPATVVAWGPGDATTMHAHHAIHLVLARRGRLRIASEEGEREAAGTYVPGDLPHAIDARGAEVVIAFVDPESEHGAGLARAVGDELQLLDAERVRSLLAGLTAMDAESIEAWLPAFFAGLGVEPWRPRLHPGVAKALARIGSRPESAKLDELAELAGLSASRFSHAFKESVGLPLRRYLLWLRLLRAARGLQSAASLTEAAYQAGFSDAAHMSRTFRRMFGSSPSEMLARSSYIQASRRSDRDD